MDGCRHWLWKHKDKHNFPLKGDEDPHSAALTGIGQRKLQLFTTLVPEVFQLIVAQRRHVVA